MMLDLWSRRRKRTQWMSFDTYMKSLPAEEQATIKEGARAILAKRKHRVRAMIWTRTGPYWCRRFFRGRGESGFAGVPRSGCGKPPSGENAPDENRPGCCAARAGVRVRVRTCSAGTASVPGSGTWKGMASGS